MAWDKKTNRKFRTVYEVKKISFKKIKKGTKYILVEPDGQLVVYGSEFIFTAKKKCDFDEKTKHYFVENVVPRKRVKK